MQELWIEVISMQLFTISGLLLIICGIDLTIDIIRKLKND